VSRRNRTPLVSAALAAGILAAGLAVSVPSRTASAAVSPSTQWVSDPAPLPELVELPHRYPSVSADGRWVAWTAGIDGYPSPPSRGSIYLKDRATGAVRKVADGGVLPAVSADGCFVAYLTDTPPVAATPSAPPPGPYLVRWTRDDCPGGPALVHVRTSDTAGGLVGSVQLEAPTISDDGSLLSFTQEPRATTAALPKRALLARITSPGGVAALYGVETAPADATGQGFIAGGGTAFAYTRYVAATGRTQVERVDVTTLPTPGLLPAGGGVSPAGAEAYGGVLSRDGAVVAFLADDPATEQFVIQAWADDLRDPVPPNIVSARGGEAANSSVGNGNDGSYFPPHPGIAISGDGLTVAFVASSTNLVQPAPPPGTAAPVDNLLVAFRLAPGVLDRLDRRADGSIPTALFTVTGAVSLSFHGRAAAFDWAGPQTRQAGLVPGAPLVPTQVFLRERPPELTLGPAHDFGVVTVGQTTGAAAVEVRNTGLTPLVVSTVAGSVGNAQVDGAGCAGRFLSPGEVCQVTVRMQVTAGGLLEAAVVASSAGPFVDAFPVSGQSGLRVTGVVPTTTTTTTTTTIPPTTRPTTTTTVPARPALVVTPPAVDFGSLALGTPSAPASLVLRNAGNVAVTVASVSVAGDAAGDFTLVTSCRGVSLAPGATCSSTVIATPSAIGSRTAQVLFTGAGASATASLAVTGADLPSLVANPAVGSSGSVTVVTGRNFPAGATVTLQWLDGRPAGIVVAGADGSFAVPVLVLPARFGSDAVVAVDPVPAGGTPAQAAYLVVHGTASPPMAGPLLGMPFRG
jgi:hypothetical protein